MSEALRYFFYLGALGFGGPLAAIASVQKDLVEDRCWISSKEFLSALALIKSMPGPVAFQMILYLAIRRLGRKRALACVAVYVMPSFFLMIAFALGTKLLRSDFAAFLGLQAATSALILFSLKALILPNRSDPIFWSVALATLSLSQVVSLPEPVWIVGGGLLTYLVMPRLRARRASELGTLFWICFKAGAFVFGTGLAIVPLLENDFVSKMQWISREEFLNAVAYGQVTPGPVTITATYLGFRVDGIVGAVVATVAIFLPSALHMLTWFPGFLQRNKDNPRLQDFSLGAIAAVSATLISFSLKSLTTLSPLGQGIFILSLVLLIFRMPGWLCILIGAFTSLIFALV